MCCRERDTRPEGVQPLCCACVRVCVCAIYTGGAAVQPMSIVSPTLRELLSNLLKDFSTRRRTTCLHLAARSTEHREPFQRQLPRLAAPPPTAHAPIHRSIPPDDYLSRSDVATSCFELNQLVRARCGVGKRVYEYSFTV